MSGLFSQNNLLLCGMQGNNALFSENVKKDPKSTILTASWFSLLISVKFAARAVSVLTNINGVTLQHNKEFSIFIFYLWFC